MIPIQEQQALRELFERDLRGTVKMDLFSQRPTPVIIPGREECELCPLVEELASDIARLSPKITLRVLERGADKALEERYGVERPPALVVRGEVNRPVLFTGAPVDWLFTVLCDVIILASQPAPPVSAAFKKRFKRLRRPVRVRVFASPNIEHCGRQAGNAASLALLNPNIRVEIIEVTEFPALGERYGVTVVPFTVIDERELLAGVVDVPDLLDEVVKASEHETVIARSTLFTGRAAETSMPLSAPQQRREEIGETRPSGLIIPRR